MRRRMASEPSYFASATAQGTASVLRSLQRRPARIRAYFHAKDVRYAA